VHTADGGLVIRCACPAGIEALSAAAIGDGRWLVLSSGGTAAHCWPTDAEDLAGAPRYAFDWSGRPDSLALARLPGRNDIVVAHSDPGKLLRWDRVSGQPTGEPVRHPALRTVPLGRPLAAVDSPGGPFIVTDSAEGGLRRWDAVTGKAVGEAFGSQSGAVWALAAGTLTDGSPVVVSGGADGLVHCWDPGTGTERGEPIRRCGRATAIAVIRLAAGQSVVCVLSAQGNVHRHDLLTGEPVGERVSTGWQPGKYSKVCRGLMAVAATDAGAVIATCTDYRSVRLWDLVSGAPAGELPGFAPAMVRGLAAAYLPDGTPLIVAGDSDGTVHRFDARNGQPSGTPVQPHGWSAFAVLPIAAPDGRIILAAQGRHSVGRFDARTGEAIGGPWRIWSFAYEFAAAALPDGRIVLAAAGEDGITRQEVLSGAEYPPAKASTIWDVATVTLPGGRVLIAGAGHDGLVYRWDAATGEMIGEPLAGHRPSVKAVATARQADGAPMFVTGCEKGQVLRWDAESGKRIGPPFGIPRGVRDLEVVNLPGGRQILAGLDDEHLYRWDPVTGESLGPPVKVGTWARIVATHVDRNGTPTAFVWIPGGNRSEEERQRVGCWRLDTGTRVNTRLPGTLRAVFDDAGTTWMVLGEPDGSLVIRPLFPNRRGLSDYNTH
jgi:WD40 repeat protein